MAKQINQITNIDQLKIALKNHKEYGFLNIMKAIEIPYDELERHFTWKEQRYTRNSIIKNEDYELLIICWERGQDSPIHDYDKREAWVHIIRGELKEEKYKKDDNDNIQRVSTVTLGVQDFSYVSNFIGLHRYINTYDGRTVSMHLYVPPFG